MLRGPGYRARYQQRSKWWLVNNITAAVGAVFSAGVDGVVGAVFIAGVDFAVVGGVVVVVVVDTI